MINLDITNNSEEYFKKLKKELPKIEEKVIKKYAEEGYSALKNATPISRLMSENHLKNLINIKRKKRNGVLHFNVNYGIGSWRVHFVASGTIYQNKNNFFKNTEREIQKTLKVKIKRDIIKEMRRVGL